MTSDNDDVLHHPRKCKNSGGVAASLAAQGSGQICCPFILGFWKLETGLKHNLNKTQCYSQPCRRQVLAGGCNALFLLHTNTYETYNL